MNRLALLALLGLTLAVRGDEAAVKAALGKPIIGPRQALLDLQEYLDGRLPKLPEAKTAAQWEKAAAKLRQGMLDRVVLRGEARKWAQAKARVEFMGDITGGEGYKVRTLRYEALPGMWIPALLYVPSKVPDKMPVMLAVNGHDRNGKAADYKQVRCINLAKRGMLVLNVEWFGMGQLRQAGYAHGAMNQLDLCGTSGLAPFFLAMSRGLDVLLNQPNADPERVAVSGLSGGGWQTIYISALDTRVTLSNPVAGYSGFRVRLQKGKGLGDSEQTPVDMATVADYTHLTAMRAPRATLLTYNAKDECCFEAGYALPPLLDAARPVFKLFGKENALRSHVNHDPGTHNFEKDNREALYRMIGDYFYPGDKGFDPKEVPCDKEVKKADDLHVDLPKDNASFNSLARELAKSLPHDGKLPTSATEARAWQVGKRQQLRDVLHVEHLTTEANEVGRTTSKDTTAVLWKLRLGKRFTVPVVELTRGKPEKTAILLNDAGRAADPVNAERLLKAGYRVLAVDVFYFGESKLFTKDYLFALLVSAVGDRPLGVQAGQLAAVARWSLGQHKGPVQVVAIGPRTALVALAAAAVEEKAVGGVELDGSRASLKEVIDENRTVEQMPEIFCFGLLEVCDVEQLAALAAPRVVTFLKPGAKVKEVEDRVRGWRERVWP